jgi:hypothetical protein
MGDSLVLYSSDFKFRGSCSSGFALGLLTIRLLLKRLISFSLLKGQVLLVFLKDKIFLVINNSIYYTNLVS